MDFKITYSVNEWYSAIAVLNQENQFDLASHIEDAVFQAGAGDTYVNEPLTIPFNDSQRMTLETYGIWSPWAVPQEG